MLTLLAAGRDNAAVARRLGVSSKRNHVSNIITKLHLVDRSGAIIRARDAGMGVEQTRVEKGHHLPLLADRSRYIVDVSA